MKRCSEPKKMEIFLWILRLLSLSWVLGFFVWVSYYPAFLYI